MTRIRLALFDYGGVLLELADPLQTFGIGADAADFAARWLHSDAVRAHETGRIDAQAFAQRAVTELALPYDADEFLARFDRWPGRVDQRAAAAVQAIPRDIECALLSNINARHWAAQNVVRDFGGRLDHCFLSFEIGHCKPDTEVFAAVLDSTGYQAAEVLFIDDNPANVAAAGRLGFDARHCPAPAALPTVLAEAGLIAAPQT